MKRWTVYCHTHVESGRRYVGLTSQTMESRWKKHVYTAKSSKGGRWHFPNAIRKYGKDAFKPEILGVYDTLEEANEQEKYWIDKWDLTNPEKGFNLAKGGGAQPHSIRKNPWDDPKYREKHKDCYRSLQTPTARAKNIDVLRAPESRAKRSIISKEIRSRPEVIVKMAMRIVRMSNETRSKISKVRTGTKSSLETRMKVAEAGRNRSEETRRKISEANHRRVQTPATKAKLSAINKGKKLSAEHRAKLSAVRTGKQSTEAVKAKISASLKAKHAAKWELSKNIEDAALIDVSV